MLLNQVMVSCLKKNHSRSIRFFHASRIACFPSRSTTTTNRSDDSSSNRNDPVLSSKIPEINFSVLLDPGFHNRSAYRSGMHRTKDGTLAAKFLIQERQDLVKRLYKGGHVSRKPVIKIEQQDLEFMSLNEKSAKQKRRRKRSGEVSKGEMVGKTKPFHLVGHGVPVQLLRDHLMLCKDILLRYNAVHCSFANFFGECGADSVEWIHVRNEAGENLACSWPPKMFLVDTDETKSSDFEHRLDLYLAVMGRVSSKIFCLLHYNCLSIHNTNLRNWNARLNTLDLKNKRKHGGEDPTMEVEIIERSDTFIVRLKLQSNSKHLSSMVYEAYFTIPA